MLTGNIVAITSGATFAIIVSLVTRGSMSAEQVEAEWEKTRDIDNPLSPWVQVYKVRSKNQDFFKDRHPTKRGIPRGAIPAGCNHSIFN